MGRAHGGLYAEECDSLSCETDSPMGRAHGGLYAEECDSYRRRFDSPDSVYRTDRGERQNR